MSLLKPNIQTFTANGTWTAPPKITVVCVLAIGGGGGGGGGCRSGTTTQSSGGGGGGGGGWVQMFLPASMCGSSQSVTVGGGGTSGTGTSTTSANDGGTGSGSSFGSLVTAPAGAGGAAGHTGAGAAPGQSGAGYGWLPVTTPAPGFSQLGTVGSGLGFAAASIGPTGSNGGGGAATNASGSNITPENFASDGGVANPWFQASASSPTGSPMCGTGGDGGLASTRGGSTNGADGNLYGGGGGGGASKPLAAGTGGNGGTGAAGIVIVMSW